MKRRFTDEQIIGMIKGHEAGVKASDLCRKHGISEGTYYKYNAKLDSMTVSDAKRLRELNHERRRFAQRCLELPDLRHKVIGQALEFGAQVVLIEKAGPGRHLFQQLYRDSPHMFPQPKGIVPNGDKVVRLEAQTSQIEADQVFLPKDAPQFGDILSEVLGFPNTRHDDQVDSLSQFLKWASRNTKRQCSPEVEESLKNFGPKLFKRGRVWQPEKLMRQCDDTRHPVSSDLYGYCVSSDDY